MQKIIEKILEADNNKNVEFVVLYGSKLNNRATNLSDIDLAIYYSGNKKERFNFRIKLSGILGKRYDVQIFQDIPLFVKKEVIKGKILFYKNYEFTFNIFMQVIKDFGFFEKHLKNYYELLENETATA